MGCYFLLPGIFPTQGLNPCLLHCRQILYRLRHQGSLLYREMLSNLASTFKNIKPPSKWLMLVCPTAPRTVVFSTPNPMAGHCWPVPLSETPGHPQACLAQSLVGSLHLSPGSWCAQGFVCALQESISPVLWKFCNQTPLTFKVKFPGGSQSLCRIPGWEISCGS